MRGILGRKVGMTQIFDDRGEVIPVTVIEAGPCFVTQVKTEERDGYGAIQLGFEETKPQRLTRGQLEHLRKNHLPPLRILREIRVAGIEDYAEGQKITVNIFDEGELVDVTGTSKGRGFAGGIKRHGFRRQPKTHGQSDRERAPGAVSSGTRLGHVRKGKRMPGHMGNARVTAPNLRVVKVDPERNLLVVRGAVPGPKKGLLLIKEARKQG
ncbi:MAG: 50S ribosomal protein L3 [Chloroflexi bacterium]|nr:50S ribosomal protein L3 [Chloroflexota bacterium]